MLVSVLLLGFKLNALKRLVQVNQRRSELKTALALLLPKLEDEDLLAWLDDVNYDRELRQDRIGKLMSPSGCIYSPMENGAIETCLGMFELFDSNSGGATTLKSSRTIMRAETKYDVATRLLLGRAEAEVRVDPREIVAHLLNQEKGRFMKAVTIADANIVRSEILEEVNAHHKIVFLRFRARGLADRTFLASVVAKKVAEVPPTYLVAIVPIPSHDKLGPRDEAGAVRAEGCRSFRCTELAPGVTKLEYSCGAKLKGWVPQVVTDTIVIPQQSKLPPLLLPLPSHAPPISLPTHPRAHVCILGYRWYDHGGYDVSVPAPGM